MMYIELASEYKNNKLINDFIREIPTAFNNEGRLLYDKRNTIKSFHINIPGISFQELVVKKFKNPTIYQSIIYSFFRSSKAVRAFKNAAELRRRGINTPHAIACIEEYQHKLLKSSYSITCFTDGQPIRDFFITPVGFNHAVAEEFTHFVIELHKKGILHHDLNSTNVLYHQSEQGNYFSVIDINRMAFSSPETELTPAECFENLTRFTGMMDLFEFVLQHYIALRGWDKKMIESATKMKIDHDRRRIRRKAFFGNVKKICHV